MRTATRQTQRNSRRPLDRSSHDNDLLVTAFETSLNWMALACRDEILCGLVFGHATRRDAELALTRSGNGRQNRDQLVSAIPVSDGPRWVQDLAARLQRYASGEPVDFLPAPLELNHLTPFAKRVIDGCRHIPWGKTCSYGELAAACGAAGAARAVGTVMARNRYPLVVPCHRVLAAGGAIGGYSARDGLRTKRRLLTLEGSWRD